MNDRKLVHNFKSYLGLEDSSLKINNDKDTPLEELKPKLLGGELVIGVAHNVLLFSPVSENQQGRFGSLFVTNYKLSFVSSDELALGGSRQESLVLGPHDITLSMVGSVFEVTGGANEELGSRRRPLRPFQQLPRRVQGLQIVCKNMRVLSFGFKFSPTGQGRTVAAALLHHAFPRRHDLLFIYDQKHHLAKDARTAGSAEVNMFHTPNDWRREMERTNCQNWRLSRSNGTADGFCAGAGESLVVPASVLDCSLQDAARHFRKGRVPVWVWSTPGGAALARSGELSTVQSSSSVSAAAHAPESTLLEAVRRAHPNKTPLKVISLTTQPLKSAIERLGNLCAPRGLRNFWEQDNQFYSSLESSRWLRYVSECLTNAAQAAEHLADNVTVVLQEGDGMDYCAVISSLTQLLLDSHFRTIKGFQSLIQKEWIALGHPFCDRLGHMAMDDSDIIDASREMSPVFLLFLDCCWQLTQQFSSAFQFTGVYLTTIWDAAHNQLFDTFLFNNPRDREVAEAKCHVLRSVWDWEDQLTEREIQYFYNPLFAPSQAPIHPMKSVIPTSAIRLPGLASPTKNPKPELLLEPSQSRLTPNTGVASLELWSQCFLRWLPPLNLPASGEVQMLLHNMRLVRQITTLQRNAINSNRHMVNGSTFCGQTRKDSTEDEPTSPAHPLSVSAFFPFVGGAPLPKGQASPLTAEDLQLDSQSILNAPD